VTAVAVFPHPPDAEELLRARLARGWVPTVTQLKSGDRILGYAECVMIDTHRVPRDHPSSNA
jgi:hypothetical protein